MPPIETFAKRKTVDLRGRRRLTTAQLAEVDQVGRHPLDDLLYFTVQKGGSRGYELRYLSPETGKRRDMAIGRFPETDPATARERAAEVRALIANNVDPLEERLRDRNAPEACRPTKHLRCVQPWRRTLQSSRCAGGTRNTRLNGWAECSAR